MTILLPQQPPNSTKRIISCFILDLKDTHTSKRFIIFYKNPSLHTLVYIGFNKLIQISFA